MTNLEFGGLGLLSGLHAASWGAYKDTPYEGFRISSFLRSVLLAVAVALILSVCAPGLGAGVVLVGVVYAIERLATEGWKAILREQDQTRYTIPMRLAFRGRPVDRKDVRYLVGGLLAAAAVAALTGLDALQAQLPAPPGLLIVLVVGSIGGWVTAIGGAWKDAPIEGFSGWKFVRSPTVAAGWAIPLSFLTDTWVTLLLASSGFGVASIETYKTFFTRGKPPGKFAGQTVCVSLDQLRHTIGLTLAMLWLAIALTFAATVRNAPDHQAITGTWLAEPFRWTLLGGMAVLSAGGGFLVVWNNHRLAIKRRIGPPRNSELRDRNGLGIGYEYRGVVRRALAVRWAAVVQRSVRSD